MLSLFIYFAVIRSGSIPTPFSSSVWCNLVFPCLNSANPHPNPLYFSSNLHFLHFKFLSFNFLSFKFQQFTFPLSLISCNLHSANHKSPNQHLIRLTKSTTKLKLLNPSIPVGSTSLPWVFITWYDPVHLPVSFGCFGRNSFLIKISHQVFGAVAGDWLDWQ